MRVNIKGLINRLDSLSERIDDLLDNLEELEDVKRYLQNDDTFNLSVAIAVLEQADKLDRALEIIKEKDVSIPILKSTNQVEVYNHLYKDKNRPLTQEEYELLKEVFACGL